VDISSVIEAKMAAVRAYKTQFYDPNSTEPETVIAGKYFLDMVEHRSVEWGQQIGVTYGEGLIAARIPGVTDLTKLL
jgi:LmbE family N-acetylglucosaminyl deacetylase